MLAVATFSLPSPDIAPVRVLVLTLLPRRQPDVPVLFAPSLVAWWVVVVVLILMLLARRACVLFLPALLAEAFIPLCVEVRAGLDAGVGVGAESDIDIDTGTDAEAKTGTDADTQAELVLAA